MGPAAAATAASEDGDTPLGNGYSCEDNEPAAVGDNVAASLRARHASGHGVHTSGSGCPTRAMLVGLRMDGSS